MNKQQLPEAVAAGRHAIEYCMVCVATHSRNMNSQDMSDLHGLTVLLRQYKHMMGKQIVRQCKVAADKRSEGYAA